TTYSINSNILNVYKETPTTSPDNKDRTKYDRYYMTYANPSKGPYKDDYTMNLRNGNLQVSGEDYDYYYEGKDSFGKPHITSPKFMDFHLYWQYKSWGKWRDDDYHYSYNKTLCDIRIDPGRSNFYLPKSNASSTSTFCVRGFKNNSETSSDLSSGNLTVDAFGNGDYKNSQVCYYLPKFNWTPEPATPTKINLESELLPGKIDNCSYMWRFLSTVFYEKPNVFSMSEATVLAAENSATSALADALTISKPEIEFTSEPVSYPVDLSQSGGDLTLNFKVHDESNTDSSATYNAVVYIDTNSDGKLTEDEIRDDTRISSFAKENNQTITVDFDKERGLIPWKLLVTENVATASKKIPAHSSKTGYAYIKPAEGEAITINAIMILPGAWATHQYGPGDGNTGLRHEYRTNYYDENGNFVSNHYKNFASQILNKYIKIGGKEKKVTHNDQWQANQYIGCVFESPIFDSLDRLERMTMQELGVGQDGIGADGFPHLGFKVNGTDILIDIALWDIHQMNNYFTDDSTDSSAIRNKFAAYNMMILGFADSWGKLPSTQMDIGWNVSTLEGLELESAQAIEYFVNSGRATLFCHDSTNRSCVFINYIANDLANKFINAVSKLGDIGNRFLEWLGFDSYFDTISDSSFLKSSRVKQGYYNNIVLREALGLDRYGITYAIRQRSVAIANGKDPDVTREFGSIFADGNEYGNAMGAAHYVPCADYVPASDRDKIYAYKYAKDAGNKTLLSVENMMSYKDSNNVM
ncbi:MAG: DUF5057 domain-containing protein, partial [Clostridia bacterium]|nr:DUF5057 domain-containing protein [Clostridia bacterium]